MTEETNCGVRISVLIHYVQCCYADWQSGKKGKTPLFMFMEQTSTDTRQGAISYWLPVGQEAGKHL